MDAALRDVIQGWRWRRHIPGVQRMRRLVLLPLVALLRPPCILHPRSAPPPPPPPPRYEPAPVVPPGPARGLYYYGEHALPGGGWCYLEGPHEHDFYPERAEHYAHEGGYYYWRGPLVVTYYAGHPLPGGGW